LYDVIDDAGHECPQAPTPWTSQKGSAVNIHLRRGFMRREIERADARAWLDFWVINGRARQLTLRRELEARRRARAVP
jgi:hypothetical protein